MTHPEVTVVMAVRNGSSFIAEAIGSILTQSLRDFAFVIVDDGSSDVTPRILAESASRDRRVRVVTRPPRGLVEALNEGCGLAQTTYIARMDADDVADASRLETQLRTLRGSPNLGLLGTAARLIDSDGRTLGRLVPPATDREIRELLEKENAFVHSSVMFRRDIFADVGGYRAVAAHAEDYDLWLRMADVTQLANLENELLAYRVHAHNVTGANLRQQVLTTLGVRAAAELRRAGRRDPLDDAEVVDLDLLAKLEIGRARLKTGVEDAYIARALSEHRAGRSGDGLMLLAAARDLLDEAGIEGDRARLDLNEAYLRAATRRYATASTLVVRAVVTAPISTVARLTRRCAAPHNFFVEGDVERLAARLGVGAGGRRRGSPAITSWRIAVAALSAARRRPSASTSQSARNSVR